MRLAIVTATIAPGRARPCMESWTSHATREHLHGAVDLYLVVQGVGVASGEWKTLNHGYGSRLLHYLHVPDILGVVPAFAHGVAQALKDGAEVIACLHDDLLIEQDGWDQDVLHLFHACPKAGLIGFGGARGLGSDELYRTPYNPMQLARQSFGSNMRDAEAHGQRWTVPQRVACLDGFSQIGTADFWRGTPTNYQPPESLAIDRGWNLFNGMAHAGVLHHFYDGALGCYAARLGYHVWFCPVAVHHFGGRTAVADARYLEWAKAHVTPQTDPQGNRIEGDGAAWTFAHAWGWNEFRDVLPIRT